MRCLNTADYWHESTWIIHRTLLRLLTEIFLDCWYKSTWIVDRNLFTVDSGRNLLGLLVGIVPDSKSWNIPEVVIVRQLGFWEFGEGGSVG